MSAGESKQAALVPTQSNALTKAGSNSLAVRGRTDLQVREGAEEWLRRGLELLDAAPADPRSRGPINPYADPPTDLTDQLRRTIPEYIKQVSAGTSPELAAKNLRMSPEDEEMAHVAHFFMPDGLAELARIEVERIRQEKRQQREQSEKREEMLKEAFRCFERGIQLDSNLALLQHNLGMAYEQALGVDRCDAEANVWYRKSADQGLAASQARLGCAYYFGSGLPQDYEEAAAWFHKAAEQGDADAQYFLGVAYSNGEGVEQDDSRSSEWLSKAAEQGKADAIFALDARQFHSTSRPLAGG